MDRIWTSLTLSASLPDLTAPAQKDFRQLAAMKAGKGVYGYNTATGEYGEALDLMVVPLEMGVSCRRQACWPPSSTGRS